MTCLEVSKRRAKEAMAQLAKPKKPWLDMPDKSTKEMTQQMFQHQWDELNATYVQQRKEYVLKMEEIWAQRKEDMMAPTTATLLDEMSNLTKPFVAK